MEKASFKLFNDRKRKRIFCEKESPFPVPVSSLTGITPHSDKWCWYTGHIKENYVLVQCSGDMDFLYKMGYFGKGTLSRHQPVYGHGGTDIYKKKKKESEELLKITSRRKYLRHLAWSTGQSVDILPMRKPSSKEHDIQQSYQSKENKNNIGQGDNSVKSPPEKKCKYDLEEVKDQSYDMNEYKVHIGEQVEDPWANTTEEESSAFWGTASIDTESQKIDFCGKTVETTQITNSGCSDSIRPNLEKEVSSTSKKQKLICLDPSDINTCKVNADIIVESCKHSKSDKKLASADTNEPCKFVKLSDVIEEEFENQVNMLYTSSSVVDPLCLSDHEDGDLFVVNDTDESDTEVTGVSTVNNSTLNLCEGDAESGKKIERLKWEPTVKRDPAKQKECLQLTFEEAYFLSYGLGCLVVLDEDQKPLNLTELWKEFTKRQKSFIPNYIAYHYFRSKGWVPKTGIKFGGDIMLYKVGPPFYHASYVVMLRTVDGKTLKELPQYQDEKLTWRLISGRNRVIEQAAKELMLCYVIKPDITDTELQSPKCIHQFKVQEIIMRRWLTKHERDNLQYTEIP